jgi:hypothetical protein
VHWYLILSVTDSEVTPLFSIKTSSSLPAALTPDKTDATTRRGAAIGILMVADCLSCVPSLPIPTERFRPLFCWLSVVATCSYDYSVQLLV